jgi:hypothetical protein
MIYLSIATEILIFSYFASYKLSTMVLSITENYSRQIIATKPILLHSKSVFKQITYKFTVHELQSNKFQRGGGGTSSSAEKTEPVLGIGGLRR